MVESDDLVRTARHYDVFSRVMAAFAIVGSCGFFYAAGYLHGLNRLNYAGSEFIEPVVAGQEPTPWWLASVLLVAILTGVIGWAWFAYDSYYTP